MAGLAEELLGQRGDVGRRLGGTFRPRIGRALRVAQRTRGIAGRPLAAIGNDISHLRRAFPAVGAIRVLDNFFAAAGLDVDINIGRPITVRGEKTLEKQLRRDGLGIGNAQREAHRRIGGRAAALAQDILAAAKIHQVAHDQKVAGEAQLFDDAQLMPNLLARRLPDLDRARSIALLGAAPDLVLQPTHFGMPLRHREMRQVGCECIPGKGAFAS